MMHNDQSLHENPPGTSVTVQFIHLGDKLENIDKTKDTTDEIKKTNKENTINI